MASKHTCDAKKRSVPRLALAADGFGEVLPGELRRIATTQRGAFTPFATPVPKCPVSCGDWCWLGCAPALRMGHERSFTSGRCRKHHVQ